MDKGWRWTQWCLLFICIPIWLFSLTTEETYKKIILQKRAKRLGIEPPKAAIPGGLAGIKFLLTVTLFRPINMLFTEPIVLFLSLYSAFTFGVLFCFLPAFGIVFQGVYGFDNGKTGLTFLGLAVGIIIAAVTGIVIDRLYYRKQHDIAMREGRIHVAPEHRLYSAMIGGFGVTIGLFWFAWTARKDIHWIVPILGTVPFAWGNLCVFSATALYMIDVYGPLVGASALGANGLARYAVGAAFPLFTVQSKFISPDQLRGDTDYCSVQGTWY
jgi:Major Facilitator Superfamily